MKKIIKHILTLLIIGLILFGAVFSLWLFFEGFDNSAIYQWLYQCDNDLAVWGIAIILVIILTISAVCLSTSILMPYYYESIYHFVEKYVDKWFPQNNIKKESEIQHINCSESKIMIKETSKQSTIIDLDHTAEVISGKISNDKTNSNKLSNKRFVNDFNKYFPAGNYLIYDTWTFANEDNCEQMLKLMFDDNKTIYFYEETPEDIENLLLGIQTGAYAWRIIRNKNINTKRYDFCIYDYFEGKQYLLIDPLDVNRNEENYKLLYKKLSSL